MESLPEQGTVMSSAVRLAHFSDIHVTVRRLGWSLRDLRTKRLPGWFNLRALGRGFRFRRADHIVRMLMKEMRVRKPDCMVFSGDASCLGFPAEMTHAAKVLDVAKTDLPPGFAVPGNHDYYTRTSATLQMFEREFAPWMLGERVDDQYYPFARKIAGLWLIGVNSCTANIKFWDASGAVGADQCARLKKLLARLDAGPRIMVTHYPICLADGRGEIRWHDLRDLDDVVKIAADGGVGLWLHGHRHVPYFVAKPPQSPFPVICAGSATRAGMENYTELVIEGKKVKALRRIFAANEETFRDGEMFEIVMPV